MALGSAVGATTSARQLGALVSPGPLSRPHAQLEGIRNCQKCHEAGEQVSVRGCLTCHQPIAQRIAAKKGVHRAVTTDCVACHVEHMGIDAELRPFDVRSFDHARDAGYPLDGKHAPLAAQCIACHKTRSYTRLTPACASCHADPHKGSLGSTCERCHTTQVAFKETNAAFDHSRTAFPLTGEHRTVACTSCHRNQVYRGIKFAQCSACHQDPHKERFGPSCSTCHVAETWRTKRVDHDRTDYPLMAKHQTVECAKCHVQPAIKVKLSADRCAVCHKDPHRGEFVQDCKACHTEAGFAKAPFDHATTPFPLSGKHASTSCVSCHKPAASGRLSTGREIGFRGLTSDCVSCHEDAHDKELGLACQNCHGTATFKVPTYKHMRAAEFFAGQHAPVSCDRCHTPTTAVQPVRTGMPISRVRYKNASTTCATCHKDVHLGQVGDACERCHSIDRAKFSVANFPHERTKLPLTGAHASVDCSKCHKSESGTFPAGTGAAVRLTGLSTTCAACHRDVHLGQVVTTCETCHSTTQFKITGYKHRNTALASFFAGRHLTAECSQCHKSVTGRFPAGQGTAVQFKVDSRCTTCHVDVHKGQLGERCIDCHKLEDKAALWVPAPRRILALRAPTTATGVVGEAQR